MERHHLALIPGGLAIGDCSPHPREPCTDPHSQLVELPLPPARGYAVTRDRRQFNCVPCEYDMITRWLAR